MNEESIPMQLLVAKDATSAHLHILGNITKGHWLFGKQESDTDAVDVAKALADLPETCSQVTVHINSMGGEVAQGVAIYNALRNHKAHVTTICEGFACSIASVIFMAGDDRVMSDASLLMIHEAWMAAGGNAKALRKAADDLDTITELSKRAYLSRASDALTREELDRLMAEETWILPEQAVEWGLATRVAEADDADEPEQSAMRSLMRLATGGAVCQQLTVSTAPTAEEIADLVVERLRAESAQAADQGGNPPAKTFMQRAALLFAD